MFVVDTDVLIDLVDQREPAFSFLARLQAEGAVLATTSINVAELLRGVSPGSRAAELAASVVAALQEVPFGPGASRRFATLLHALDRAGTPLPVVDGLIAAATLEAGGRLVTRNERDFTRVAGLDVLVPS